MARASVAVRKPATPAAALQWPRFVLTEPMAQVPVPVAPARRKARVSASISIGSPSAVPLPWVCT